MGGAHSQAEAYTQWWLSCVNSSPAVHSLIQNNNPSSQSRIASMVATWPIIHVPLPVKHEVN